MNDVSQQTSYVVRASARARHLRITVKPGGGVVVTVPPRVSGAAVAAFLERKKMWIARAVTKMKRFTSTLSSHESAAQYRMQRQAALEFAAERVQHFNALYGFSYSKITIRNQKTRWGSCSRRGNLSFNYRLLELPPALADYIVVHELCHLKEFNHSKKFWALVALAVPNAVQARRQLRQMNMAV